MNGNLDFLAFNLLHKPGDPINIDVITLGSILLMVLSGIGIIQLSACWLTIIFTILALGFLKNFSMRLVKTGSAALPTSLLIMCFGLRVTDIPCST